MRTNKSGKIGWWTKERQQYAYDRLRSEAKLSDAGAKGLISRWANVEATAGPAAKNPVSGAHGIGQWLGERKKALGGSVDFSVQIDHAIDELNGKEKKAGDLLRNATTAEEGATGASAYERAEGYNARTKRDNFTNKTLAGMSRVAVADTAAPSGGLASFFSDPLGLQAQAAEAPTGLAAFAAPEAKQQAQIDYFGSVPTTDWSQQREEAIAQREAKPALPDASFNSRFAANQPALSQPSFDARFGAPASPDASRFAHALAAPQGPVSPEHYASAVPASAPARAAFDAIAAGIGAPDQSTPASKLGAQIGAMAAPQEPGMITDAKGSYADPFSSMAAQAAEMPSEASAFTEQPHTVTTQAMRDSVATQPGAVAPGLSAPKDVKDYNVAASQAPTAPTAPNGLGAYAGPLGAVPTNPSLSPDLMGAPATSFQPGIMSPNLSAANWAKQALKLDPTMAQPTVTPDEPTIDDPNAPPEDVGPQGKTIAGDFPSAHEDSMFGPVSKATLAGLLTGGPIGGLLGAASGMIGGGLGSLGNAAYGPASAGERFSAGTGLGGMQSAMSGQRGATGYSRSQPGVSVTSRGRNLGWDLTNQFGATTPYDANGNMMGNRQSLSAWGRVLGGLFDKDKSKKGQSGRGLGGLSQAAHNAIGKGLGGLY